MMKHLFNGNETGRSGGYLSQHNRTERGIKHGFLFALRQLAMKMKTKKGSTVSSVTHSLIVKEKKSDKKKCPKACCDHFCYSCLFVEIATKKKNV